MATASLYLCEASWSLHETGCHWCGCNKKQGQENLKVCLRSICYTLQTVVQVTYCSTLWGIMHVTTAAPHFSAPDIMSQLRFCLEEFPLLKKKMQKTATKKIRALKATLF